ncbi:MAG: glycosyltransferase, partial [Desulfobacteraceae bacterium]
MLVEHGRQSECLNQEISFHEDKIAILGKTVTESDSRIVKLNKLIADRDKQIYQILRSISWRSTSTLRAVRRFPVAFFEEINCFISKITRFIWRRFPVNIEKKTAFKNALFHNFSMIFSRTSAFRAWQSHRSGILETADKILDGRSQEKDLKNSVKRYENSRTTISVYVPYNFMPQTFGGGVRILNVYERLSNSYNINLIGVVGFGERLQIHELNDNCTVYLVPMSKEYYDLLSAEQQKAGGLLHDILISNEYKMIPDLIDISSQLKIETDIFISTQPYFFKLFLEYFSDKTLIYDAQNVDYELKKTYFQHPDSNESAKHYLRIVREVELLACQQSEYILGVSGEDVDKLCETYDVERNKIVMVPNGIDVHACHYISANERKTNKGMIGEEEKRVVFIGSAHGPNIEAVQYIINEVAAKNYDIHYTIIGNVNSAFEDKIIPRNVHFTGMISEEEKKKIYKTADLSINPMFSGSGTNLKVLEYLACGIPLVSTEFGMRGLEVFNDYIYFAQKEDFGEAIEKTIS